METNIQTILIIFVALTAVSVLLQACVLLGILISLRKAAKSATELTNDMRATVLPMVHSTRELVERIAPQIVIVTANLSELTQGIRNDSADVRHSITEIMQRLNKQSQRLDAMLTTGLDTVERASGLLEAAVALPVRQVNGIFAAFKAVVDVYRTEEPRRKPTHSGADQDLFI